MTDNGAGLSGGGADKHVTDGSILMTDTSDSSQSSREESAKAATGGHKLGRWQFSLRGLMLFVLLVAMGMALFTTGWKLRRAEKELADYRREYGILNVENPAMLCAVARWTPEPGQWRWQVHFPPGRYDVCYATAGIQADGFPKPVGGFTSDFTGDVTVSAVIVKGPKSGQWMWNINAGGVSPSYGVTDAVVNPVTSSTGGVLWNQEPAVVSPQTPVVLLRRRVGIKQKNGSSSFSLTEPSDGLMLWIRRVGDPTGPGVVAW
jgi:hypothetical protein